ncbi:MAG: hypothetical protein JNG85_15210 [Spirochaetaceae bacterium]|nr:hypothetical protein [Spirochaetaceae bacterium]
MKSLSCQFEGLADRQGFNATVRHIQTVIAAVDRVTAKENLADVIGEYIEEKSLDKAEVLPVVSMVLGEKFKYRAVSVNLPAAAADLDGIAEEAAKWNAVDLVAVYHHPDLGPLVVNPKNPKSLAKINRLSKHEIVAAWAGRFAKEAEAGTLDAAASALVELFAGRKPKVKPELLKGDCVYKAAKEKPASGAKAPKSKPPKAPAAAAAAPKRGKAAALPAVPAAAPVPEHKPAVEAERALKPGNRMTPMYSVQVTNELFHNGNVEAWKRVIASYNAKYPSLQVLVYYDGERITDINSLFKWGKVKHGSSIQFAVAGDEIQGVAKLQRYLAQGASPQFEAFLRGPVNAVLPLF